MRSRFCLIRFCSKTTGLLNLKPNLSSFAQFSCSSKANTVETDEKVISNLKILNIDSSEAKIGRTNAEHELMYIQQPDMPANPKLVKVSILGLPNSGKSTLVNRILSRRVSAVSSKINTTQKRTTAVFTENDTQVVILDTPGLVSLKKRKKLNMDRSMIIDPHSSLWEADVVCVVHDVSDDYSCNRIDREILKCLFAHPEKESILILNKIDKVKERKKIFDIVLELTGGCLNGKEFLSKSKQDFKSSRAPKSIRNYDYERLFMKTAEKMNLKIEAGQSNKEKEIISLLEELKECEKYLLDHKKEITFDDGRAVDSDELTTQANDGITLEMLSDNHVPALKYHESTVSKNPNKDLSLIASIASQTAPMAGDAKPPAHLRSIEDISPAQFKRDLMQTTDWHLYYKKLNALGVFVRDKVHWPYFNQVFMISAKQNDGVNDLRNYLLTRAKKGEWQFPRSLVTDQMPSEIAEMCVREKMLEILPFELPYEIDLQTTTMDLDDEERLSVIVEMIPSPKTYKRQLSILFDRKAYYIKTIREQACNEMRNTFNCEVNFKLVVRMNNQNQKN